MTVYNNQQAEGLFTDGVNYESAPGFMSELDKVSDEVVLLHQNRCGKSLANEDRNHRENRNISSIVSKIRDEGAAFGEEIKTGKRKIKTNNIKKLSPRIEKKKECRRKVARIRNQPEVRLQERIPVESIAQQNVKNNRVILYSAIILALLLVSGSGFMFYQIQQQTRVIRRTLASYKKDVTDKQKNLDVARLVKINMIAVNQKLTHLSDELIHIKASYKDNIRQRIKVQAHNKLSGIDNHSDKKIASRQLATLTRRPVSKLTTKRSSVRTIASRIPVQQKPVMYAINLVAFSDEKKAHQQLNQLKAAGLLPALDAIRIDGRKLYRLSLDGFSTRDEASRYASIIKQKYGFNGWVQQVQGPLVRS